MEWFSVRVPSQYLSKMTLLVLIVVAENANDAYTQHENECEKNCHTKDTTQCVYLFNSQTCYSMWYGVSVWMGASAVGTFPQDVEYNV